MHVRQQGRCLLALLVAVLCYFLLLLVATPFIHSADPLLRYFPRREYGLIVPALCVTCGALLIFSYTAFLMATGTAPPPTSLRDR